jgi:hypothetical protein
LVAFPISPWIWTFVYVGPGCFQKWHLPLGLSPWSPSTCLNALAAYAPIYMMLGSPADLFKIKPPPWYAWGVAPMFLTTLALGGAFLALRWALAAPVRQYGNGQNQAASRLGWIVLGRNVSNAILSPVPYIVIHVTGDSTTESYWTLLDAASGVTLGAEYRFASQEQAEASADSMNFIVTQASAADGSH